MKQKGFTLIELLVVIVIIGILATISVATFSGYFAKARDTERQAAVRNASTVLKTALAVGTITTIKDTDANGTDTTVAEINAALSSEGGYAMPTDGTTGYGYAMIFGNTTALQNEFAIIGCSEENATARFVDGTAAAETAVGTMTTPCAGVTDDNDPGDDTAPTNYTILNF